MAKDAVRISKCSYFFLPTHENSSIARQTWSVILLRRYLTSFSYLGRTYSWSSIVAFYPTRSRTDCQPKQTGHWPDINHFRGHSVSNGTLAPIASQVSKVLDLKTPSTKKQVRSLMGLSLIIVLSFQSSLPSPVL